MQTSLTLNFPLILASNSPRRREILTQAGFDFSVLASDVDESFPINMPLAEVPIFLSEKKAKALANINSNAIILAADTVVILGNKILNKPADKSEAREMLQILSGQSHQVITGITLISPNESVSFADAAQVTFRTLADWEMDWYVKGGFGLDKAGAYGVQDFIGMAGIQKLEGSFYTVMGLPIYHVFELLKPYILDGKQSQIQFN
jgi:septum formation protein